MKYQWSDQARIMAKHFQLTEEEKCDCEKWIEENIFIIGDKWLTNWVIAVRDKQDKFNQ